MTTPEQRAHDRRREVVANEWGPEARADYLAALIPKGSIVVTKDELAAALEPFLDRDGHYIHLVYDDDYHAHLADASEFADAILARLRGFV